MKLIKKFLHAGSIEPMQTIELDPLVVYPSIYDFYSKDAIVDRALRRETPNMNFNDAVDIPKKDRKKVTEKALGTEQPTLYGIVRQSLSHYPFNCINTATGTIHPGWTIARNSSLYKDPTVYGMELIPNEEARPGDLMQFVSDGRPIHSVIVRTKNGNNVTYMGSDGLDEYYKDHTIDITDPDELLLGDEFRFYRYNPKIQGKFRETSNSSLIALDKAARESVRRNIMSKAKNILNSGLVSNVPKIDRTSINGR